MADLGKDFADRAMARYKGKADAKPSEPDEDDTESSDTDSDTERDNELGKAVAAAYRKGNYAALTAAIRAICA